MIRKNKRTMRFKKVDSKIEMLDRAFSKKGEKRNGQKVKVFSYRYKIGGNGDDYISHHSL